MDAAKTSFVLDNSPQTPIVAGNVVSLDSLRTEVLYAPVGSTNRLELPLTAFFQAGPRLRLYGGATLNYLLRANVQPEAVVTSRLLNRAAQGNVALLRATDPAALRRLATASQPSFDVRLNTGLGWRLHKRIELHANWQYSFQLIKQETASAYAENLAIGGTALDPNLNANVSRKVFPSVFTLGATVFLR